MESPNLQTTDVVYITSDKLKGDEKATYKEGSFAGATTMYMYVYLNSRLEIS